MGASIIPMKEAPPTVKLYLLPSTKYAISLEEGIHITSIIRIRKNELVGFIPIDARRNININIDITYDIAVNKP